MSNKTTAIVAYLTLIGWVIALVTYNNSAEKSSLVRYHLRQMLGLLLLSLVISLVTYIIPGMYRVGMVLNIGIFILWLIGIINAASEKEKPIPLVGNYFEEKLTFIA